VRLVATLLAPYHLDEHLPPLAALVPDADVVLTESMPGDRPWVRYAALHERVATEVTRLLGDDRGRLDVVTGDCLVAAGTVAGLQRAGHVVAVVWFDGHGDVHTAESTTSGYPGGLALRVVAGHRPPDWPGPDLRGVAEDRIVLVGARDLDPAEVEYLDGAGIRQVAVAELTADVVPDGPLLLHVDLDVVDAAALPGLRFPVTPGPSPAEVVAAARRVLATGRVVALEVAATWFPVADPPAGRRLVEELLAS
jgi:arginase